MNNQTLISLLKKGRELAGDEKIALVSAQGSMTYRELWQGALGIASRLQQAGISRGNRVGIWMEKSLTCVQAIIGILYSGAAYVPLDPRSPLKRCFRIAQDCGLSGWIVDETRLSLLSDFPTESVPNLVLVEKTESKKNSKLQTNKFLVENIAWSRNQLPSQITEPRKEDAAYLLYTSGSTGTPKGVVHTHASGCSFVEWVRRRFAMQAQDVFSSHAPFHFDLSISDLFVALSSGATIRVLSSTESILAAYLARMLDEWGITVWYSVPSILISMMEAGLERNPPLKLKTLFFAGEVFPTPQLRRLREILPFVKMYNLFGPTETNVCTYHEVPNVIPPEKNNPIPIGKACEHLETFVLNDEGKEVQEIGEEGTLWAKGPGLMREYWNDYQRTSQRLCADPRGTDGVAYNTGDLVRILSGENYEFLGRRDHLIKTRGYRVELGEIEAVIACHPAVLEAVAVPLPDAVQGNRIVASVVLRHALVASVDEETLTAYCRVHLPIYMVPEKIELRPQMPRTSTGKVDRAQLLSEWERRVA